MADIFEIKKTKVELKIGDRVFEIKDPKFASKIMIKKEWDKIDKEKDKMEESEFAMAAYELNKKTIKIFIPEITDEFLEDEIPSSALDLLIKKIGELTEQKFGAVIEKTEKK